MPRQLNLPILGPFGENTKKEPAEGKFFSAAHDGMEVREYDPSLQPGLRKLEQKQKRDKAVALSQNTESITKAQTKDISSLLEGLITIQNLKSKNANVLDEKILSENRIGEEGLSRAEKEILVASKNNSLFLIKLNEEYNRSINGAAIPESKKPIYKSIQKVELKDSSKKPNIQNIEAIGEEIYLDGLDAGLFPRL